MSAPDAAIPDLSGASGARKVVKHTILSNPKMTAYLLGALVVAIVVLAYFLWRCKKSGKDKFASRSAGVHQVSNFQTGGNQAQWSHGEQSGPISIPDAGLASSTVSEGSFQIDHASVPKSAEDLLYAGLMGGDPSSVAGMTSILGSGDSVSALDQKIGSMCSSASSQAQSELAGHAALNGGLSGGHPTPQ